MIISMVLRDVMVPGKELLCDVCKWTWVTISQRLPAFCANPKCHSREWNGKKQKRKPRRAPTIELPKPQKRRLSDAEETDDTSF